MTERCSCEVESLGPFGPVNDNEELYRVVLSPQHFLADKKSLKPSFFSTADITRKGISLIRIPYMDEEALGHFCSALAAMRPERAWAGGFHLQALCIRSLSDPSGRLMCLFDDPAPASGDLPKNDAHALAVAVDYRLSEEDVKEIRAELLSSGQFRPR